MKRTADYISHFFYLARHWNIFLACFVMWHEITRGARYRIHTIKRERLENLTITGGHIGKSSPYEAVTYYVLEKLFAAFRRMHAGHTITDLGCGKGRVLVVSAHYGFTRIHGVDFAQELCREAELNMKKVQQQFPGLQYRIVCSHVLHYQPEPDETVFFMFNPFDAGTLENFILKNQSHVLHNRHPVYFIYASPQHVAVLKKYGFAEVYQFRTLHFLHGVIMRKEPG